MSRYGLTARGPDKARGLVQKHRGPLATVYACPFCKHTTRFEKSRPGSGVGRGYGLRMGGTLHSQMAAHIRAVHPGKLIEDEIK